jgi:ABC-2 type transport system ATP-binding protein
LPEFVRSFSQPLASVTVRQPTLDDVFLNLTGREIRDEELDSQEQLVARMARFRGRQRR